MAVRMLLASMSARQCAHGRGPCCSVAILGMTFTVQQVWLGVGRRDSRVAPVKALVGPRRMSDALVHRLQMVVNMIKGKSEYP